MPHPGDARVALAARREQGAVASRAGVQPAESPFARQQGNLTDEVLVQHDRLARHLDLAVVRRHQERRARHERLDGISNEAVGGGELCVIVLVQAVFVRDLVDAVVVGIDELCTATQRPGDLDADR